MKARATAAVLLLATSIVIVVRQQRVTASAMYANARLAFDLGKLHDAMATARKGQRRFGDDIKWRELFATVIVDALSRSDTEKAMRELELTPRSADPEAAVRRLMSRGYLLADKGGEDLAKADRLAARVMPSLRAEIAVRRAGCAFWVGDTDQVDRLIQEALQRVDPARQPIVLVNARFMQATVSMQRGNYQEAIERYDRCMSLAVAAGARGTVSKLLGNYGWCFMRLGDTDEARVALQKSADIGREQGDLQVQLISLGNIAGVALVQRRFHEAVAYAEQSVQAARRHGNNHHIALALTNLAQAEIESGRSEAARKANDEALALWKNAAGGGEENYALLNAARIEALSGDRETALHALACLEESPADLPLRWNVQAAMAGIYRDAGRASEAERMYEAALDTGDVARVETKSNDAYLFAFESNLIRTNDEYIEFLLELGRPLEALRVVERSRARTLLSDRARPPFAPTELARSMRATLLCYWLAPQRSLLWVVTPEGVSVVRLPPAASIDSEVDAYREEIIERTASVDSARGARLFQMLVAPALQRARSNRFIVVPDGHLNVVSLESLVASDPAPHYWVEDATVSYAPALALIPPMSEHRAFRDSRALLIGDVPAQGTEFPALPQAGAEIGRIARHFESDRCRILTGDAATPAAYLKTDPQRFSHLHFVAHSTASVRSPLESSVVLARGKLSGTEIIRTPLRADLVTVSSCNSAGRRTYAGEGPVGLAWAFLRAGARRVVASQWDVSDTATANVMDGMYNALAKDHAPAEALREAKLELLRSGGKNARPFYWAPFILYGAP